MQKTIPEAMFASLKTVFEEAAYVVLEEAKEESVEVWDGAPLVISLSFTGAPSGELWLATSAQYTRELAASILGLDEEDPSSAEKGPATLMELLNMIVGGLLVDLFGSSEEYRMGLPKALQVTQEEYSVRCSQAKVWLHTTDYFGARVDLLLFSKEQDGRVDHCKGESCDQGSGC